MFIFEPKGMTHCAHAQNRDVWAELPAGTRLASFTLVFDSAMASRPGRCTVEWTSAAEAAVRKLARATLIVGSILGSCMTSGCSGSCVNRGAALYEQGRYIDAAQVFEHNERFLADYHDDERIRYALYRAATMSALGDRIAAERWVAYANGGPQRRGSATNVRARYSK